jgi:hypothetical protein
MLSFRNVATSPSRKTKIWSVYCANLYLGEIKWYAPWRQYCFAPIPYSLFDHSCLMELAEFCNDNTKNHRKQNG